MTPIATRKGLVGFLDDRSAELVSLDDLEPGRARITIRVRARAIECDERFAERCAELLAEIREETPIGMRYIVTFAGSPYR